MSTGSTMPWREQPDRIPDPTGPTRELDQRMLVSDDATLELVLRARTGDREAVEALLQRSLPQLRRWAHGRLPLSAGRYFDTNDLVQEAALHLVQRLDKFEPQHVGALQAYLRQSVLNRIRDEIRKVSRQPPPVELPEDEPSDRTSPLEVAIQQQTYERYRRALTTLGVRDRELIVARIEAQWSLAEIAHRFQIRTVDAARMAVTRAVQRLIKGIQSQS